MKHARKCRTLSTCRTEIYKHDATTILKKGKDGIIGLISTAARKQNYSHQTRWFDDQNRSNTKVYEAANRKQINGNLVESDQNISIPSIVRYERDETFETTSLDSLQQCWDRLVARLHSKPRSHLIVRSQGFIQTTIIIITRRQSYSSQK